MENVIYKVLLIEDDKVDQAAFKRHIEKECLLYDHSIASSVSEAKKILSSEAFDVAIIDYRLGDGTAFDIIDLVVSTPFIIVTGAGDEEVAVKAMKAGAHDYLIKDNERNYLKVLPVVIEKAIITKKREDHLKLLSYAIMSINDSVYFTDMGNKILFVNNAFYKTYGYNEEDIIGKHCGALWGKDSSSEDLRSKLSETTKGVWCGEIYHTHKDESKFPIYISRSIVKDENGIELGIVSIVRDITEKRAREQRLEYIAHFDDLTGLPNRVLFYDRLNKLLSRAKRDNLLFALLVLDLDRFKDVNDTLGHDVGDLLLRMTAKRLINCLREADTVARLGGDEFAIILAGINEPQNAAASAQRIITCLENPFRVKKDNECTIGASIGITTYPFDGNNADILVKNADIAMYQAKRDGKNRYEFYNPDMNAASFRHFTIENKLREAIKREEFILYYQPQMDINTEKIVGIEALIRWQAPGQDLALPGKFMSIAEETGLIITIGEWILLKACSQNKTWQNTGFSPIPVAVNVSARQFKQQGLAEIVAQVLNETGLDPRLLEIELTESILMHDEELVMARLGMFTAKGVRLSIDDFGTGYSSMRYLKRLPIHKLKIDKSFVDDITTDPSDRAISEAIVTMAHSLQLKVIAEGVETKEQLKVLRSLGCDEMKRRVSYSTNLCQPTKLQIYYQKENCKYHFYLTLPNGHFGRYPVKKNGFSLVELIVVIVIIGILTGLILPVFLHGGLDEGVSTLQSSVLSAKTFAVTKRKRCTLTLNADYYTGSNPLPCLLTIQDTGISTFKKQYRLPKYIRFWQYNSADFTSGTKIVYFEPRGISHGAQGIDPQDIIITIKDIKTGLTTSRTIIGNTCQIKK